MRGQQSRHYISCHCLRIIPARAGPTRRATGRSATGPDPSPLVRGQRRQGRGPGARGRIIPARAGPTTFCPAIYALKTDHPRSCGANAYYQSRSAHQSGSSPLVRGQRRFYHSTQLYGRIIPARAGPTRCSGPSSRRSADHPRSCGANLFRVSTHLLPIGSSPLVRGQRFERPVLRRRLRIIPARAGPTTFIKVEHSRFTDHPRSCGANGTICRDTVRPTGSSPLVRGQQLVCVLRELIRRIIPARAGPTFRKRKGTSGCADHPRSCGANVNFGVWCLGGDGSSPLVRGQRLILRGKSGLSQIKIFDYSSGIWQ